MWIEDIKEKLSEIYGDSRASQVARNIIPSCINDFRKVIDRADVGSEVEENYQTEDRQVKLVFVGERRNDGGYLSSVVVNGTRIEAGVELK